MLIVSSDDFLTAGVDEAGRGPIAGGVFAAAVILPPDFADPRIKDSKKLSHKNLLILEQAIKDVALSWAVAEVSPQIIDEINILQATFLAMNRAIEGLSIKPEKLLIDGNRFRTSLEIEYETVVGGDNKYLSIAAASILAKTARDRVMEQLGEEFPAYGFARHKGYPTKEHLSAVERYGATPHHRMTFSSLRAKVR